MENYYTVCKLCNKKYPRCEYDCCVNCVKRLCINALNNKYSQSKIYKIINSVDNNIYIGSTTQKLNKRFAGHKSTAKKSVHTKVYKHFNKIGWDNVTIQLIELYQCSNEDELHSREMYWYDKLKPTLNSINPKPTIKQQKLKQKLQQIEYRQSRKEHYQKITKIYRESHKEEYTNYYNKIKNTQKYKIRRKNYLKKYSLIMINCKCGCKIQKYSLSRHLQTKKHKRLLKNMISE